MPGNVDEPENVSNVQNTPDIGVQLGATGAVTHDELT
jgi:hypothetical protein